MTIDEMFPDKLNSGECDKGTRKCPQHYCVTNYGFQLSSKRNKRKRNQIYENLIIQGNSLETN